MTCIFAQTLEADCFQIARSRGIEQPRGDRLEFMDLAQSFLERDSDERRPVGQKEVKDRAKGINVAGRTYFPALASSLLRRGVRRRAQDLAGESELIVDGCGLRLIQSLGQA